MSHRTELLEHERRKLSLLRNKLVEQEQRVKVLEQMQDDPLDAVLDRELAQDNSNQQAAAAAAAQAPIEPPPQAVEVPQRVEAFPAGGFVWQRVPRRIPPQWAQLLAFIGSEGKTFTEVEAFIKEAQLPMTPGAARTGLMNYRKDFGFVENPRKGFYKTTDKAMAFMQARKDESPTTDDDGASESQPTPLDRAAA